jgi:hypothetical protein
MTTDTALGVTKKVVHDKSLYQISYLIDSSHSSDPQQQFLWIRFHMWYAL